MISITIEVHDEVGPSLRSAIEEFSSTLATKLEGQHVYSRERSLSRAAIGVAALRSAINKAVPRPDPNYSNR